MKISSCFFLFAVMIISVAPRICAQAAQQDADETSLVLPPLAVLIDSALQHSAAVKLRSLEVAAKECNLKSYKNYWTRNFGVQADTRYGTFDNYSSNANGQSTTISTSTNRQMNYGAGIFLKFPVIDIVDRKNQLHKSRIEIEQASRMAEAQQEEVRRLVIRQYQELLLTQRLLNIKAQAFGNARVNMNMVEKQFRNGNIPVSEYVRISDIVDRVESDYETAKAAYATSKMIFEDIIGFHLTAVLRKPE